jgi:hypothetical protein
MLIYVGPGIKAFMPLILIIAAIGVFEMLLGVISDFFLKLIITFTGRGKPVIPESDDE